MSNSFVITLNCTKILGESKVTHYTMFIDDANMTIVYELIEWIRWVFSVKGCIFLMYKNSIIHELEDIKVLSKLNYLELIPCSQSQCVHKQIYRTLLNNLNLFVFYKNVEVPKFFFKKICNMEQKLAEEVKQDNYQENNLILASQTKKQECFNNNLSLDINASEISHRNLSSNLENINENENVIVNDDLKKLNKKNQFSEKKNKIPNYCEDKYYKNKDFNEKNDLKVNKENLLQANKNEIVESSIIDSVYNKPSLEHSPLNQHSIFTPQENLNQDLKNSMPFILTKEELKNQNTKQKQQISKNSFKSKKLSKNIKPFSVGEILTNIRNESKKLENFEDTTNTSEISLEPLNLSFLQEENFKNKELVKQSSFHSSYSENFEGKKRKRTRTRKKKKQKLESESFFSSPIKYKNAGYSWDVKNLFFEKKPNHIRFNAADDDDDDDDNNDNVDKTEFNKTKLLGPTKVELNIMKPSPHFFNAGEIIPMLKEEKKILPASVMQNPAYKCDGNEVACFPVTKSLIQAEEKELVILEKENQSVFTSENTVFPVYNGEIEIENSEKESESCIKLGNITCINSNQDINTILELKKKFPSPLIVKRFY